jgi:hypothetical protein
MFPPPKSTNMMPGEKPCWPAPSSATTPSHNQRVLQKIVAYVESTWPDLNILNDQIELI